MPALVTYSTADNTQAADAVDALPPDSILRRYMADYRNLRAQVKAMVQAWGK